MFEARPLTRLSSPAVALLAMTACAAPPPSPAPGPAGESAAGPAPKAGADPYHPAPRDTVEVALYRGWQQYSVHCARCHGEDGQGSSFAPSLLTGMRPGGKAGTREEFMDILINGRTANGMPTAAKIGIDSLYFDGLYRYLQGRSEGRYHGGRPARQDG